MARASGTGDIARAQAHEDADGFTGNWSVVSYAVCVQPPAGYEVVYASSDERLSETNKVATALCPGTKRVHGAGGAITKVAPGNVSLQAVVPIGERVQAIAVENTPTDESWDFIVAQAICAY